jgi:hypothetical protein
MTVHVTTEWELLIRRTPVFQYLVVHDKASTRCRRSIEQSLDFKIPALTEAVTIKAYVSRIRPPDEGGSNLENSRVLMTGS